MQNGNTGLNTELGTTTCKKNSEDRGEKFGKGSMTKNIKGRKYKSTYIDNRSCIQHWRERALT